MSEETRKVSEQEFEAAICKAVEKQRGFFFKIRGGVTQRRGATDLVIQMPSLVCEVVNGGSTKTRTFPGFTLWLECKVDGGYAKVHQKAFMQNVYSAGGRTGVVKLNGNMVRAWSFRDESLEKSPYSVPYDSALFRSGWWLRHASEKVFKENSSIRVPPSFIKDFSNSPFDS